MKKKVLFHQDGYLNGKLTYEAGKVYEIDDKLGSATRWLKRGAEFVADDVKADKIEDENKDLNPVAPVEEVKVEGEIAPEADKAPEEIVNSKAPSENKRGKKN